VKPKLFVGLVEFWLANFVNDGPITFRIPLDGLEKKDV
jgi:hypothetical protein